VIASLLAHSHLSKLTRQLPDTSLLLSVPSLCSSISPCARLSLISSVVGLLLTTLSWLLLTVARGEELASTLLGCVLVDGVWVGEGWVEGGVDVGCLGGSVLTSFRV
jgi:hypothetical protein